MSELTKNEKAKLLGEYDNRHDGDIDEGFYELLKKAELLGPGQVDDKIRRSLLKYIEKQIVPFYTGFFKPEKPLEEQLFILIATVFTGGFITGFQLARKTKRSIKHSGKSV